MKRIDYKIENEKIIVYEQKTNKILFEIPDVRRNKIRVENLKESINTYKDLVKKRLFTRHFHDDDEYFGALVECAGIRSILAMIIAFFIEFYYRIGDPTKFTSTLLNISLLVIAEGAIEPLIREHLIPTKEEREYKKMIKESYNDLNKRSKGQEIEKEEIIEQEKVQEQQEEKEKIQNLESEKTYNITPTAYSEDYTYDDENIINTKKR